MVIVLLSGDSLSFSWAAGSLFTFGWNEPKKIVDTCSMVLVGCLVFGVGFCGEGEYEI